MKKDKHSFLVVYRWGTELENGYGNINITTDARLTYEDLSDTKEIISIALKKKVVDLKEINVVITNIIDLRVEDDDE